MYHLLICQHSNKIPQTIILTGMLVPYGHSILALAEGCLSDYTQLVNIWGEGYSCCFCCYNESKVELQALPGLGV